MQYHNNNIRYLVCNKHTRDELSRQNTGGVPTFPSSTQEPGCVVYRHPLGPVLDPPCTPVSPYTQVPPPLSSQAHVRAPDTERPPSDTRCPGPGRNPGLSYEENPAKEPPPTAHYTGGPITTLTTHTTSHNHRTAEAAEPPWRPTPLRLSHYTQHRQPPLISPTGEKRRSPGTCPGVREPALAVITEDGNGLHSTYTRKDDPPCWTELVEEGKGCRERGYKQAEAADNKLQTVAATSGLE